MALISASGLDAIRAVAESGMTGTCSVKRRTTGETANGQESTYATVASGIACWVREMTPVSTTLGAISGAVGVSEFFSIRVATGTDIRSGDQIVIGTKVYSVEHTSADSTYAPWLDCAVRLIE